MELRSRRARAQLFCLFIFVNKSIKIEELQPQLESKVCGLGVDALAQLAEHLQVETKDLGRLALSKENS